MSRYEIRVRQADSLHGTFACDSVYVDGGGDLKVNRFQRPGDDLLTIARFQHGHWSSYELEPTVEATADDCADAPVKAEALPEVGASVHMWRETADGVGCTLMPVIQHITAEGDFPAGLLLSRAVDPDRWPNDWTQWITRTHDETRSTSGSWHYPCEDGGYLSTVPKSETPEAAERRHWYREHEAQHAAHAAFADALCETVRHQRRASLLALLADVGVTPDASGPVCIHRAV